MLSKRPSSALTIHPRKVPANCQLPYLKGYGIGGSKWHAAMAVRGSDVAGGSNSWFQRLSTLVSEGVELSLAVTGTANESEVHELFLPTEGAPICHARNGVPAGR